MKTKDAKTIASGVNVLSESCVDAAAAIKSTASTVEERRSCGETRSIHGS